MNSDDPTIPSDSFPTNGRLAAVDFGSVRIGIAICDPDRILASPLEVHPAADWQSEGEYFRSMATAERISGFVVGLPIHCDGGESQKSEVCRKFARWLAEETELPVRLFDERFTTADAMSRMAGVGYTNKKKKKRVDAIAAQVILESFIEACRYRDDIAGEPVDAKPAGGESL
jgi:putative Holliday junction resolvase